MNSWVGMKDSQPQLLRKVKVSLWCEKSISQILILEVSFASDPHKSDPGKYALLYHIIDDTGR